MEWSSRIHPLGVDQGRVQGQHLRQLFRQALAGRLMHCLVRILLRHFPSVGNFIPAAKRETSGLGDWIGWKAILLVLPGSVVCRHPTDGVPSPCGCYAGGSFMALQIGDVV